MLADALDLVKGHALINLDMKAEGCEEAVLELLRAKGMLGDTLISSLIPDSLRRIRALEPAALTGYSYPEDKRGASQKGYLKPVVGGAVATMRRALPYRLPRMMAYAQANAVMLYHKVVSPGAVRAVHRRGGKVFVWTVDDAAQLERFREHGRKRRSEQPSRVVRGAWMKVPPPRPASNRRLERAAGASCGAVSTGGFPRPARSGPAGSS